MVPFILAILVALFPPVHVFRCECISTTVTKEIIVKSTFEVIGANGRFEPFQVKYLRPTRSSRGAPDLLTHPPFQPWEEAFWIVIDHGKGKLEAVVSPTKAREYLPDLQKLTRSLNPETVKNGVQTQESQELNYVGRLAALVSATIEPEMRDRLPEILVRYRESEEPILRAFVRWYDSRPLKGPMFAQRVEQPAANDIVGGSLVGLTYNQLKKLLGPPISFDINGIGSPVFAQYLFRITGFVVVVHATFFEERVTEAKWSIRYSPKAIR